MRAAVNTPVWLMPRLLLATLSAMIALAWLAMWQLGASPYAHYVHHSFLHGPLREVSLFAAVMFVAGWLVMTVAMMLPTSVPLLAMFAMVVRDRQNRRSLLVLVALGYLVVWTAAGVVAYALAAGIQAAVRVSWLNANPWVIGSAACIVGGAFQFSKIKYACLERCRSTFGFINEHWSGKSDRRDAFRLGAHHGVFCVGCCWALMLTMITVGAGHLGWMLILGTVMALEKNVAWGRAVVKPVGLGLLLIGLTIALTHQELF
jgi:predicted metal-binding membrane protein